MYVLTLPEYLNSEVLIFLLYNGNDLTSLSAGVTGFVSAFLLLLFVFVASGAWLPSSTAAAVEASWLLVVEAVVVPCWADDDAEVELLFTTELEDVEVLPPAFDELEEASVFGAAEDEAAEELLLVAGEELAAEVLDELEDVSIWSVADDTEAELLSGAVEELAVDEVLPATFDELETVEVLVSAGGVGALATFCLAEGDAVAKVASSGWAGWLSMVKFRKSLPNLLITMLKN